MLGALVGGLAGSAYKSERWEPIGTEDLHGRPEEVRPERPVVRLALGMSF